MSDVLNIFLSYKMPRPEDGDEKTDVAKEFARVLSDTSAGRIVAHYAGNFGAGKDWRTHLISTIQKCDIFVLLYTGAEQQWEFCMLEAGLFRATHPDRELIVLHHQRTKTPEPLGDLKSVKVTVQSITQLLSPIFYEEPWLISKDLTDQGLNHIATELVRIFNGEGSISTNFDLVPNFVFDMTASEETRAHLQSGMISDNTKITGSQSWQMLFDKSTASQTLTWGELKNWPVKLFYNLKFSRMAITAIAKDPPGGCFLRPSVEAYGGTLFRIALRRYEEYANQTGWRFYFTAAPIDIPIFGIGDTTDTAEIMNYHLLNVCWYTRRRLILVLQKQADNFASSAAIDAAQKNALVAAIKDEIASINIQTFIRRIDHPKALGGVFPLKEIQDDQKKWLHNTSIIDRYRDSSEEDFRNIVAALAVMKAMNDKYYCASAAGFARAVATDTKPSDGRTTGKRRTSKAGKKQSHKKSVASDGGSNG